MKLTSLPTLPQETVSHNPAISKKVLLRSGTLPNLTNFSQACFPPGECAAAHHHADMYEVFFVEAGVGQIRIQDTSYLLQPGTCVVVEPGETHEVLNTGTTELVLTYFGLLASETGHP